MVVQGDAKYRLPKGTMPSIVSRRGRYVRNASFRIVLSERRCWTKGMPSIVSRKGQSQVSSPEGDDTLERFVSHRPLRETMLVQGDAKYRLPKGTKPSIVSRRGRYVRTLRFASSSLRDDAGPRGCQVSSPERDKAKYRLPKGTIR